MPNSITKLKPHELLGFYEKTPNEENPGKPEFSQEEAHKEILRRLNLQLKPSETKASMYLLKAIHPKNMENKPIASLLEATYKFKHTTPGRSGTSLSFDTKISFDNTNYYETFERKPTALAVGVFQKTNTDKAPKKISRVKATLEFSQVETTTVEDAFNKLSEWCHHTSQALKTAPSKSKINLPT